MKNKRFIAFLTGVVVNLLFIGLSVLLLRKFSEAQALKFGPEVRLQYADDLLHLYHYKLLPAYIGMMVVTIVILWLLRK